MKKQTKILLLAFALSAAVQADVFASDAVQGISDPGQMRFMLKMDRQFIGGEVQVFSANSELIVSQKMKKRKVSIDFSDVMAGEYIVRVLKGTLQQEYHFLKK